MQTRPRSRPDATAASTLRRASIESEPWWMPIGRFWSLTAHRSWKISSARLRVLQKTSVVLCRSISRITFAAAQRPAMPGPGDFLVLGQHDRNVGLGAGIADHDLDHLGVAVRRQPALEGLRIGDGGGKADAAQGRRDRLQPRQRQRQQVAALAGGEGVDLVDDNGAQAFEQGEAVFVAEQQAQGFGRGQQVCGGRTRCRALRSDGVSPVRVSTRIGRPISATGVSKLRCTSTARALSGEM